jgi:ABC-type transport system involved in cytochrome bd biosynthesis fused ATPase/permease subunit
MPETQKTTKPNKFAAFLAFAGVAIILSWVNPTLGVIVFVILMILLIAA